MGVRSLSASSIATGAKRSKFWDQSTIISTTAFDSIATVTVGSGGQSTVEFTSIPSTYKHLQIRAIGRGGNSDVATTYTLRFNSDSSASYSYHRMLGTGSAMSAIGGGSTSEMYLYAGLTGANASSNVFGVSIWDILDYASTTKTKPIRFLGGLDNNTSGFVGLGSGGWFNTSAITSIRLATDGGTNFTQYSTFALYGIKG
jgi:hypothetical protein